MNLLPTPRLLARLLADGGAQQPAHGVIIGLAGQAGGMNVLEHLVVDRDRPAPIRQSCGSPADRVAGYVGHNSVSIADLPKLIADVHAALQGLTVSAVLEASLSPTPAVSIRKSVTPDFIVCLDDGKKFKSLKRHLSVLGMMNRF